MDKKWQYNKKWNLLEGHLQGVFLSRDNIILHTTCMNDHNFHNFLEKVLWSLRPFGSKFCQQIITNYEFKNMSCVFEKTNKLMITSFEKLVYVLAFAKSIALIQTWKVKSLTINDFLCGVILALARFWKMIVGSTLMNTLWQWMKVLMWSLLPSLFWWWMIWSQCLQPSMLYHFHFLITTIDQHGHFRQNINLQLKMFPLLI